MNVMDVTIVNEAMPTLGLEFDASPNKIEWVLATYVFVFVILLLPFGRLGDVFGRRKMFIWGVALFTFVSGLCGLAWSIETLIAARVKQVVGAAMMAPQAMPLILVIFTSKESGEALIFLRLRRGWPLFPADHWGVLIEGNFFDLDGGRSFW